MQIGERIEISGEEEGDRKEGKRNKAEQVQAKKEVGWLKEIEWTDGIMVEVWVLKLGW